MIRFDRQFEDEARELGRRYHDDDEGLTPGEFIEKYASPGLKEQTRCLKENAAKLRAEGCR